MTNGVDTPNPSTAAEHTAHTITTRHVHPWLIEPLHGVTDDGKYDQLIASMTANGWTGAPIVVISREDAIPLAVTGSHRLAAAGSLDLEVPVVELRDVFTSVGKDELGDLFAEGHSNYDALVRAVQELPIEVVDYYGLDVH